MTNKAMIGVNFVAGKGSDLVMSLDLFVEGVLLFEIVSHPSY